MREVRFGGGGLALPLVLVCLGAAVGVARAQVRITEYMYDGTGGEFIEFTNVGAAPVDFTGWSYDDDSRVAGTVSLSAFGTVAPGESVVLAEPTAATFRTTWGLAPGVKVIGGNATNLGRADEINLFNALGGLADRLTYGDQAIPGTIRAQNASGWTTPASVANPGAYPFATGGSANAPEPAILALLGVGLPALARRKR
jgi:predicted extracellular nuclease